MEPTVGLYGSLSKLWSLFGPLNTSFRIHTRERDHNFDNQPSNPFQERARFRSPRLNFARSVSSAAAASRCCQDSAETWPLRRKAASKPAARQNVFKSPTEIKKYLSIYLFMYICIRICIYIYVCHHEGMSTMTVCVYLYRSISLSLCIYYVKIYIDICTYIYIYTYGCLPCTYQSRCLRHQLPRTCPEEP